MIYTVPLSTCMLFCPRRYSQLTLSLAAESKKFYKLTSDQTLWRLAIMILCDGDTSPSLGTQRKEWWADNCDKPVVMCVCVCVCPVSTSVYSKFGDMFVYFRGISAYGAVYMHVCAASPLGRKWSGDNGNQVTLTSCATPTLIEGMGLTILVPYSAYFQVCTPFWEASEWKITWWGYSMSLLWDMELQLTYG